VDYIVTVWNV